MSSNRSPFWNQIESKRTPSCATCRFCLRKDYGISNATTEGATFHCLLDLNSKLENQELPYDEMTPELAEALDVAITCPRYRDGAPVWLDVDMEDISYDKLYRHLPKRPWSVRKRISADALTKYATGDEAEAFANYLNRGVE